MDLTQEQINIIEFAKTADDNSLLLVNSVAGSGKTTLLVALANELNIKNGLYLAYNKSIATSSKKKFPDSITCRTTHSLAYTATVKQLNLKLGVFNASTIKESITYTEKFSLIEDIRQFCLSSFLSYNDFAKEYNKDNSILANKYLKLMEKGKISCTHDFYLKLFHILLAKDEIIQVPYDLIMLDEAGDLNEVTLEIFKLLTGRIKIAVGDPHQNIYQFNHTINCFDKLKDEGTTFNLSTSFRTPTSLAANIQNYCNTYLNDSMKYIGTDLSNKNDIIKTTAFISRTNAGLISKMIELNKDSIPYSMVRSVKEIFKIPLMIAGLRYMGAIYDPNYKSLQELVDDWCYQNNIKKNQNIQTYYIKLLDHINDIYEDDINVIIAIKLVKQFGKKLIFDTYETAKKYDKENHNIILTTAHSSKGLEFDEVIIAPDLNNTIIKTKEKIIQEKLNSDDVITNSLIYEFSSSQEFNEAFNLYYVACTRATKVLSNADHI